MTWNDVERARLVEEVGLGQPVDVHRPRAAPHRHARGRPRDRRLAGRPAAAARGAHDHQAPQALGLLAHGDRDDVYTRSRTEMPALIQIALGGQVRRGALLRRRLDRARRRPALRHATSRREMVGAVRHGRARLISFAAVQNCAVLRHQPRRPGARRRRRARTRSRSCCSEQKVVVRGAAARATGTSSRRCATRCSSAQELIGAEITDVLEAAGRGRGHRRTSEVRAGGPGRSTPGRIGRRASTRRRSRQLPSAGASPVRLAAVRRGAARWAPSPALLGSFLHPPRLVGRPGRHPVRPGADRGRRRSPGGC